MLVVLLAPGDPIRAQDTARVAYQFWPELNVYAKVSSDARLFFLVAPVGEIENGQRAGISDLQVGAHVEVGLMPFAPARRARTRFDDQRMKYLRFRTGLRYVMVPGEDGASEWRVIAELTPRIQLPLEVQAAFRNRLDLRWIEGEFSWRYRPRLWLEREFHVGRRLALVPYGSAEVFWDSRADGWTRERYQLGVAVPITPRVAPEVYWAYQRDESTSGDKLTHALGIVMGFYF